MAFRDSLLAAQSRIEALERQLEELAGRAVEVTTLERDNRRLRAALARAQSEYMPTAARLLNIGVVGAGVLSLYLLVKLSLSLGGGHIHVPLLSTAAFGGMLVGLVALCQLGFGTVAPAVLLVGAFFFNQLAIHGASVEMTAIAHSTWLGTIGLGAYIVTRTPHVPRALARTSAIVLLLAGLSYLGLAVGWDRVNDPGDFSLALIANGILVLHLAAVVSVGACLFAARDGLLQTAPTPPEPTPPEPTPPEPTPPGMPSA